MPYSNPYLDKVPFMQLELLARYIPKHIELEVFLSILFMRSYSATLVARLVLD